MNRMLLVAALSFLPATHLHAHQVDREKIPVLIVSGANNHDWRWTTPSIESMLDESGLFDVTITYDPATDLADEKGLARYKALVLDYNGPRWGEAAAALFLKTHVEDHACPRCSATLADLAEAPKDLHGLLGRLRLSQAQVLHSTRLERDGDEPET